MSSLRFWVLALALMGCAAIALGDDLHFKKTISVGGSAVSSSEVWVKGARERAVTNSAAGNTITLRQCDLKRTVTVSEQSQSYVIAEDARDEAAIKAAALMGGAPAAPAGSTITLTTTVTDTGERKQLLGFPARHLKTAVQVESPASSCSLVSQKYEIDGWYADVTKEQALCHPFLPPVRQADGCNDPIVEKRSGTAKAGYPLAETITLHNADASTTQIEVATSSMPKQVLPKEQFDAPAGYRQVKSMAELNRVAPVVQSAAEYGAAPSPAPATMAATAASGTGATQAANMGLGAMTKKAGMFAQLAHGGLPGMASQLAGGMASGMAGGMQNPGGPPTSIAPSVPQALGPKPAGKIRIGVAPAQAQMGQGNDAQADYGTPIRNSIVLMMSGPAVEVTTLDARIPVQVQAEAQMKQCDYILFSGVIVKHASSGGFGKFMKAAGPMSSMVPMIGMTKGLTGMIASQAASAAMQTAQQQAVSQLASFNGQIKQKDDVTVEYHLYPTGQDKPRLENSLKGKAKSDGEDVLTPLIQEAATTIFADVTKK
jgi:ribosomal 50S subunit-recycling heat shock protein